MSAALDHLAARVATDPLFLANALAEYAQSEGIDDEALAALLGCPISELTRLRLCGAPRGTLEEYRRGISTIAAHFGIDSNKLTTVVRRGQSLAQLRSSQLGSQDNAILLAARDREPGLPPNGESGS